MSTGRDWKRAPSAVQRAKIIERGQIIQRVLVEGWSEAAAAAEYGVPERSVAAWVKSYRRLGMASLRRESGPLGDFADGAASALYAALAATRRALRRSAKAPARGPTNAAVIKRRDP
jgi:transposase-like protein